MQKLIFEMKSGLSSEISFYDVCDSENFLYGEKVDEQDEIKSFFLIHSREKHFILLRDYCLLLSKKFNICIFLENSFDACKVFLIEDQASRKKFSCQSKFNGLLSSVRRQLKKYAFEYQ